MSTLSNILNVPKLEQVFAQLLSRLSQQEAELSRLRACVESAAGKSLLLSEKKNFL